MRNNETQDHYSRILLTGGRTTVPRFDEVRRDLQSRSTARHLPSAIGYAGG